MDKINVKFKKLHPDAKMPFKKHVGDAAYDIYALEDVNVEAGKSATIRTGICVKMPEGYFHEIHTRSSHGKLGMRVHLGVVDTGYHGEIFPIFNSPIDFKINKGDRVAQLLFRPIIEVNFIETDEEFESSRGTGAFGSTGK
jgi:dUTP pyrophosphatase